MPSSQRSECTHAHQIQLLLLVAQEVEYACCKRSVIEEVGSIAGCFGVDSLDPEMS